ncbi:DNA-directed RNA polymeras-like protein III subunit Rpc34 [Aaosphaeria arxii CBS 175.79]|uniref:DNA-directed RNA polymerase III subunit RPC6 n=1 Tax=Aaosphaeria arxii CBS 175.79 TaxID=1450172 RepID=A0A6A5XMA9_9PLEO|nr:DNA-directed RNA polymeras-like protein III subunit Rpc34 [Aaosphaeria arxii CBS 175.79]KAF2013880.1 DNA-directed RNA polymeras-like protein III subunit Rpc34 [Aaosphaeria arxii CBS 175.79]
MASASVAAPEAVKRDEDEALDQARTQQERMEQLYQKCAEAPEGTVFFQRDLANMAIANMQELVVILQELVDRHLMKIMQFDGEPCWKVRTKEEAERLRKLTPEERLLYHHIDQVQADGIWSKALRMRTNVTTQMLNKCLKSLESKDLVQSVMSVKHPNRKMYLLKHLRPSEDIAGGPWQSEGEFDMPLIRIVAEVVEKIIEKETCLEVPGNWNDYPRAATQDRSAEIARKKAQQKEVMDIEDTPVRTFRPPRDPNRITTVLRDSPKYPTATSLRDAINNANIIKDKSLSVADMEQLLEMMVLEGRLEKIMGNNYRLASRALSTQENFNGFVDAPCGNCPVFEICSDEGEISARTCVYFGEWLDTESEAV